MCRTSRLTWCTSTRRSTRRRTTTSCSTRRTARKAAAQIKEFQDTWEWNTESARATRGQPGTYRNPGAAAAGQQLSTKHVATIDAWRDEFLAYFTTGGVSNGPTEATNLLIKKIKRTGHGFRNFANYRLRLLLHCGVDWHTPRPTRIRGRLPRLAA